MAYKTHDSFAKNWQVRNHKPVGNSLTIPGQGQSIQQIIDKYSKGEYVPPKAGYYGDDIDNNFLYGPKFDFSDIQSMYENDLFSLEDLPERVPDPSVPDPGAESPDK